MNRFIGYLAVAFGLLAVQTADAAFQVTFRVGTTSDTVVDNADVRDLDPTVGKITIAVVPVVVADASGTYAFDGTFAETNSPGSFGIAATSAGVNVIAGTGGPATVEVVASSDGFTAPLSPPDLTAHTTLTGNYSMVGTTVGHTATFSVNSYIDSSLGNTSATDDAGTLIGSATTGSISRGDAIGVVDDEVFTNSDSPFTLTLVLRGAFESTGGTNRVDLDGNLTISAVPVPAGLVLALSGMPVLGFGYLRRRKATKAETVA